MPSTFDIDHIKTIIDDSPCPAIILDTVQNIIALNKAAYKKYTDVKTGQPINEYFKTLDCDENTLKERAQVISSEYTLIWLDNDNANTWVAEDNGSKNDFIKKDFISTVSHEFRTPLTSIKGFADTMLSYGDNLTPEQQKRFVTIIKNQADRMIRLTENLLTVSKLDEPTGQLSFRPVALKPLLENLTEALLMKHKEQFPVPVELCISDDLPPTWADPDGLEQVLLNLVDNAIKYSAHSKKPHVSVTTKLTPDDECIVIQVKDNGIGMTQEQLDNLFHKFYRVATPLTQKVEGTGLGLYITRSLITAMNGSIEVTSKPEQGSVFSVKLPIATAEKQAVYQKRRAADTQPEFLKANDGTDADIGGA